MRYKRYKLVSPKSLEEEPKKYSWKRFLQVLMANLLSIGLTFGTSAIFEYKKKQKEKFEIVMMVMFDMRSSLESVEQSDANIRELMELQRQVADDSTLFASERQRVAELIPKPRYAVSTEKIFSSSIESINTVGSIKFTQLVSEFYLFRQIYKTNICDSIHADITGSSAVTAFKSFQYSDSYASDFLAVDFAKYALVSIDMVTGMEQQYAECMRIMKLSDEDLEQYRREKLDKEPETMEKEILQRESRKEEVMQLQKEINEARPKGTTSY